MKRKRKNNKKKLEKHHRNKNKEFKENIFNYSVWFGITAVAFSTWHGSWKIVQPANGNAGSEIDASTSTWPVFEEEK